MTTATYFPTTAFPTTEDDWEDDSDTSLPPELLGEILSYLFKPSDKSTLAACCLVSSSFLPIARQHLYRSLSFRLMPQFRIDIRLATPQDVEEHMWAVDHQLYKTLMGKKKAHLAELVQSIYLDASVEYDGGVLPDAVFASILDNLRAKLPNVTQIKIDPDPNGYNTLIDNSVAEWGPRLRELIFTGSRRWSPQSLSMLRKMTGLTLLSMGKDVCNKYNYAAGEWWIDGGAPPSFQLQVLSLEGPVSSPFLAFILSNSHNTIYSMQLVVPSFPTLPARGRITDEDEDPGLEGHDLSLFTSLKFLHLILRTGHFWGYLTLPQANTFISTLSTVTTPLEALTLASARGGSTGGLKVLVDPMRYLHAIPRGIARGLKYLTIGEMHLTDEYALEVFDAEGEGEAMYPNLIVLSLANCYEDKWEGREWVNVERSAETTRRLEEMAKRKGVDLRWLKWYKGTCAARECD